MFVQLFKLLTENCDSKSIISLGSVLILCCVDLVEPAHKYRTSGSALILLPSRQCRVYMELMGEGTRLILQ